MLPPVYRDGVFKRASRKGAFLLLWPVLYPRVRPGPLRRGGAKQHPIYFYHVQKTAGTSLAKAFESLGGEDPNDVESRMAWPARVARSGDYVFLHKGDNLILRMVPYSFAWSHIPYWKIRLAPSVFTITILRDPVERVLSLYHFGRDTHSNRSNKFKSSPYLRNLAAKGFGSFLAELDPSLLLNQLYIFSKDFDPIEAAENIRSLSLYFFTESFDLGLSALNASLELPLSVRNERAIVRSLEHLTDIDVSRLREQLEPEYQMISMLAKLPGPGFVGNFPIPKLGASGQV